MERPEFQHEYDLGSLVLVRPKAGGFSMYVTPRYRQHYEELPFEEFSADLVSTLLEGIQLFVDVGAHYGFYTLLAAKQSSSLEVLSFEPTPETCQVLARNVALNGLKNVVVQQTALSDKDGRASFNISLSSDSCGFHPNPLALPLRQLEVAAKSLDSLLAGRAPCPTLVKMDTEGHELAVLQGLSSTIARFPELQLLIEFNPLMQKAAGYAEDALLSHLQTLGYKVFLLDEKTREATCVTSQPQLTRLVQTTGYGNIFCTRISPPPANGSPRCLVHGIDFPQAWKFRARDATIRGWCLGEGGLRVLAVRARRGQHVWSARHGLSRDDVGRAYPQQRQAARSGFEVKVKVPILPGVVKLEALDQFGRWHLFHSRYVSRWRRMLNLVRSPASAKARRQEVVEVLPTVFASLHFQSYVLAISHSDYRIAAGGTQKLLQQEEALLAAKSISYLEIHPAPEPPEGSREPGVFRMGLYVDSQYVGAFVVSQLRQVLEELARAGAQLRTVHLHHLMGFDLTVVDELLGGLQAPRTFFIHDFLSICKQWNLLKNDKEFCGGPPLDSPACRECAYGPQRAAHFQAFQRFLATWNPDFVVPSKVAFDIWAGSFPQFAAKVKIVPHLVPKAGAVVLPSRPPGGKLRLAYVGYQHPNKGWEEWKRLAGQVGREHYELFILGNCGEVPPEVQYVPVSFLEQGPDAMELALRRHAIDLAFLWSLVPETYSFTLFESMAAGCFVLTNPRSGNIAAQVGQSGRGLVAQSLEELLAFLRDVPQVTGRLQQFRQQYPPFDQTPNPAVVEKVAAAGPPGQPFHSPHLAKGCWQSLKTEVE
jgi:FkbM family methyltransferase